MFVDELFSSNFPDHQSNEMTSQPEDFDCLRYMIDTTEASCGRFSDYSLKYVKNLVHICENSNTFEVYEAQQKIAAFCRNKTQ